MGLLSWILTGNQDDSGDSITASHWIDDETGNDDNVRTDVSINGSYHPRVTDSSWTRLNRVVEFSHDTEDDVQVQDTGARRESSFWGSWNW